MPTLYFDHDVNQRTIRLLGGFGHTVITARECGMHRATDGAQLIAGGDAAHAVGGRKRRLLPVATRTRDYPRIQLLTISDLLGSKRIECPPSMQVSVTFRRAPRAKAAQPKKLAVP